MKVNLFVSRDIENPHADIHTNELTENISKAINILESEDQSEMLAVSNGSDITLFGVEGHLHVPCGGQEGHGIH